MDLPKKQGNRREIGGFFEIHRIRWKTPKFGGVKNPEVGVLTITDVADGFKVIYRAVFLGKKVVFTVEIQITGWVRKLSKQKSVK